MAPGSRVTGLGLLLVAAAARPGVGQEPGAQVREFLRARLETVAPDDLEARNERVHASTALPAFYVARVYAPAWSGGGRPLPVADSLVAALRDAGREGLRPQDYHLRAIERTLAELRGPATQAPERVARGLADLDLLLSDAFLVYGAHLLVGRVNPETIDPEWRANRRGADMAAVLTEALSSGRIREHLERLQPPQPGYARLRDALARYRAIAARGGWPTVPDGPTLRPGDRDARVVPLRTRLVLAGDLDRDAASNGGDPELYDEPLREAVRRFQRRHGLADDGVIGAATLETLNVPATTRINQTELNLERWRWLPQDLGARHILVNIAAFELAVVEAETDVLTMRVMVGRPYRRTPVFSGAMTYLVLAPYWHVPRNLAVQDKLPLIKRNPGYLAQQKMTVFEGWGAEARVVDPATVNWGEITASNFPYRLRQDPGPGNALGRAKFMFPNRHNVYLHDTPSRELFDQPERAFSSGCIRVERPLELADHLLRDDPRWDRRSLEAAIGRWQEQTVPLRRAVPVHVLYWTAWAEPDGSIHFRKDLYGRDVRLEGALHAAPPTDE